MLIKITASVTTASANITSILAIFRPNQELFKKDPKNFDRFLMGLSSQSTEREDHIIVKDLRGELRYIVKN